MKRPIIGDIVYSWVHGNLTVTCVMYGQITLSSGEKFKWYDFAHMGRFLNHDTLREQNIWSRK